MGNHPFFGDCSVVAINLFNAKGVYLSDLNAPSINSVKMVFP
ncbi:hypothetical protein ACLKMH_08125 [Psychromonas sp. KJ10-10]